MNKKLPENLLKLKTNIKMLAFVTLFSFLFLFVYTPFNSSAWFKESNQTIQFLFSSCVILGSIVVLFFSRLFLSFFGKKHQITILQYCFWLVAEIVLIAFGYTCLNVLWLNDLRGFIEVMRRSLFFVPLILCIPYLVFYLYFLLREKDVKLASLIEKNGGTKLMGNVTPDAEIARFCAVDGPMPDAASEVEPEGATEVSDRLPDVINFKDENGSLKLSIKRDCVYYLLSADNYVNIFYFVRGRMKHCLVRSTLKSMEEALAPYGFVRCHRSYLINLSKVKIVRKAGDGFVIDMDQDGVGDIPISKTYADQIIRVFALN